MKAQSKYPAALLDALPIYTPTRRNLRNKRMKLEAVQSHMAVANLLLELDYKAPLLARILAYELRVRAYFHTKLNKTNPTSPRDAPNQSTFPSLSTAVSGGNTSQSAI
jgi:hypothetical protein